VRAYYRRLQVRELFGQRRQTLEIAISEARLDGDVLALDIAELLHAGEKRFVQPGFPRAGIQKCDARYGFWRRLCKPAERRRKDKRAERKQP
jgi:hypothetical protein